MIRPEDLVPPMANPAPTPAAASERFMNWRRLRCDLDIALASSSKDSLLHPSIDLESSMKV